MLNWIAENRIVLHLNRLLLQSWIIWNKTVLTLTVYIAQLAGAVEYTDCTNAEGLRPPTKCPG